MAPSATLVVSELPTAEKSAKAPAMASGPAPAEQEEMESQLQHLSFGPNALSGEYQLVFTELSALPSRVI